MPPEVLEKYESCRGKYSDGRIDYMISIYKDALSHPDQDDLLRAHLFVEKSFKNLPDREASYV